MSWSISIPAAGVILGVFMTIYSQQRRRPLKICTDQLGRIDVIAARQNGVDIRLERIAAEMENMNKQLESGDGNFKRVFEKLENIQVAIAGLPKRKGDKE